MLYFEQVMFDEERVLMLGKRIYVYVIREIKKKLS